eukprot:TRINITY_DN29532_c0_g2_i1.p1 TRINITY_DN29532_c0_g2~~TRINITY_DN29532_c0_g2_i1.p1  ORF type:complete len:242 (+),score=41.14 TRINITY_DN29532_c0_g2_i1:74-799(+)
MLKSKTVLITGAGKGIGRAVALAFAKEGASLVLAARTAKDLAEVAAECQALGQGGQVNIKAVDLSDATGVEELADFTLQTCGGCDILVNNAGRMSDGNASEGDPDDWDRMMYLNLNGVIRLTRRLVPKMIERQSGTIINMGSIAAIEGMSGKSAVYAASKHGLKGWNDSIYQGLRHQNIKVVLINPAFVNTPLVVGDNRLIPERMIQPEDVAEVCMLPVKMSAGCVPSEVTLRLTLSAIQP